MEKEPIRDTPEKTRLEVSASSHGLPCIEIKKPTPGLRQIIKNAVRANHIDDPAYNLRQEAGAFLQGDEEEWILVEFWQKDYRPFVDYLNNLINDTNKSE